VAKCTEREDNEHTPHTSVDAINKQTQVIFYLWSYLVAEGVRVLINWIENNFIL
jgi:hypothetical protein